MRQEDFQTVFEITGEFEGSCNTLVFYCLSSFLQHFSIVAQKASCQIEVRFKVSVRRVADSLETGGSGEGRCSDSNGGSLLRD